MGNGKNLFYLILLLKLCVIITTVYVIVTFHFNGDVKRKGYYGNDNVDLSSKNKTQVINKTSKLAFKNTTKLKRPAIKRKVRKGKPNVLIFVGIISAPQLIFRRNAVRRSWLKQCKDNGIPCFFFTDSQDMHGNKLPLHVAVPLNQEQLLHGDLIQTKSPGGVNFARRYLWMLKWANARYKFKYFLRVDDDYFLCMDRLLFELPHRPKKKLYWGHVHCSPPGGIRVDEGFVIVSNDLVQWFLREQNRTLMCHPYGDQAMAMWINDIPGVTYFGDPRVHHSVASRDHILQYYKDICANFLALHGSYPVEIETFWVQSSSKRQKKKKYPIPDITYPCGDMDRNFNYMSFAGMYNAEPKPCRDNPKWSIAEFYRGRSG